MLLSCLLCVNSTSSHHDLLLKRALESLSKQTFKNFELVIVLDRCHEDTEKIINEFKFESLTLIRNEIKGGGLSFVKNLGIESLKTEYCVFMDGDDYIHETKFEKQLDFLLNNSEIDFCATMGYNFVGLTPTDFGLVYDYNQYENNEQIRDRIFNENVIIHGSMMSRVDVLKKFPYNSQCIGYEDWDLWRRVITSGYKFHILQERLYYYSLDSSVPRI